MSDDQKPAPQPPPAILANFTRHQWFQQLYANQMRVRIGPGEVSLIFSYHDDTPVGPVVTELTSVTVTPTHARRIALLMTEMLKEYEATFGAIPPESEPGKVIDGSKVMRRVDEALKNRGKRT